ncbi:hypothetical protein [Sinomonas terrae]|uniref:Uncharacterized protein n=1 Tax=Sinomonas terrae TaxID=2908838 RepID=A0ABS9U5Y7_9MICC|nr:hypothetical protein [Sinomonas terrae]MCH6472084.1 hypothetical protein [Sinomonas terrae]
MPADRPARPGPQGRWGTRTLLMGMLVAALLGAVTALIGCSLLAPPPVPPPERVHSRPVPRHAGTMRILGHR